MREKQLRLVHLGQVTTHLLHLLTSQEQYLVHPGLVTILLVHQSEERFLDLRQTDRSQIVRSAQASVHQCQVIVRVQSAQVLPLDRLAPRARQVPEDQRVRQEQAEQERQVPPRTVHHRPHQLELHRPLVEKVAVATNAAELPAHLVSREVKKVRLIRAKKRFAKSSTIWRHHHSVEQLFHMVMEKLSFAYVVEHR
jgi:hypothetical protein